MGREGRGGRVIEPPSAVVPGQPRPDSITKTAEHIPEASQRASCLHTSPWASPGLSLSLPVSRLSSTLHTLASLILTTFLGFPLSQLRTLRHREV